MSSVSTTASNTGTTAEQRDTSTQIKPQALVWGVRIFVGVLMLFGFLFWFIQLNPALYDYYQGRAALAFDEGSLLYNLYLWGIVLGRSLIRVTFVAVGILVFARRSTEWMGVLSTIFMFSFGIAGLNFMQYTVDPQIYYESSFFFFLGWNLYAGFGWVTLYLFIFLFPDGKPVPRWMSLMLVVALVFVSFWTFPPESPYYPQNWNPFLFLATLVPATMVPIWGQFYRFRNVSTPAQRQQTKIVVFGVVIAFSGALLVTATRVIFSQTFALGTVAYDVLYVIYGFGFLALPISLAIAMMRYRLWNVDVVINRSIAYGVVAAMGMIVFFGLLFGLQVVIGQQQPLLALGIAGAFTAVMARPLRNRAQHIVDRRIYHLRFGITDLHQRTPKIENYGALSDTQLGNYKVLDVIGKGGMGEVYKATDGENIVAIKTLLTDKSSDEELISRFRREAEAGMSLQHPNIARVHDLSEDNGTIFLVMDYLDGDDLSDTLKRDTSLDTDTVIDIMDCLAGALDTAHQQGYVHRDIKPSNIMLLLNDDKETYNAVLMDFGITKIKDANTLTGTGAVGTIDYMAPEQIVSAKDVDHRADIYALGVVCYQMLVGKLPFDGGAAQVMFAHIQQPPPDPRDSNEDIPRNIAKAILKALAKDPDKRFDSVGDFISALRS